jgi:hypothetical protein
MRKCRESSERRITHHIISRQRKMESKPYRISVSFIEHPHPHTLKARTRNQSNKKQEESSRKREPPPIISERE